MLHQTARNIKAWLQCGISPIVMPIPVSWRAQPRPPPKPGLQLFSPRGPRPGCLDLMNGQSCFWLRGSPRPHHDRVRPVAEMDCRDFDRATIDIPEVMFMPSGCLKNSFTIRMSTILFAKRCCCHLVGQLQSCIGHQSAAFRDPTRRIRGHTTAPYEYAPPNP
ncbi:hypothetical protein N658DRAFT_284023 [Parathielavia hyrcaniae]|uniref:Uncharacterized protein n=1 Tax=Parathielavia hyrcaniae TaxID=113614 RepID=A0AAN6Q507_9PEZI|nr:hypothetical protein N658DRAFT_284023 [Parathielavia hyrcaniae]